ncbi:MULTISPECIES: hypothetical protein [unclassified Dysgonomonas]|jgi:hypothetical protein|uniref:hypothetical protein n=1 Tax=unclassified Dysgonomonas TaxID=2630389 RepID=UPI0025BA392B|nr:MULTISPECIES: hypothetical protein [unclassified Dysgonomonas]MDR2003712.1 hypothetical protein [Prevotella sp.]HMM01548.1 hypothetical protein [Dysgonomonas sp.]
MRILLLTGSINAKLASPVMTKIVNIEDRRNQYLNTIKRYIKESDFDTIIFCENTKSDFSVEECQNLADEYGKQIEFIFFLGNVSSINRQGKGFGDGECIEYAINHSKYLQDDSVCFYKVTGRLFIENINDILKNSSKDENYFYRLGFKALYVGTFFFKVQVRFFKEKLIKEYINVNDSVGKYLEIIYYDVLIKEKVRSFNPYPYIYSLSGSTGEPYLKTNKKVLSLFNYLGFYAVNSIWSSLFNFIKKKLLIKK